MIYYSCVIIIALLIIFSTKKIENNKKYSIEQNLPIRGILALLVVICHMFPQGYLLGNIAVSIFFCFSGYGLMYGYMNKKNPFDNYFKNKILNTVLPFMFFNVIYYIYYYQNGKRYTISEFIISFFNAKILTIGWYIIVLVILYIIFYLIFKKLRIKNNMKVYGISLSTILLISILYMLGCQSWWYCSLLAFIIGIWLKYKEKYIIEFCEREDKYLTKIIIVLFIVIYAITRYYNLNDGTIFFVIKVYMSISSCLIYIKYSSKYIINNKIFTFIGKYSLVIYLIHPLVIKIINSYKIQDIWKLPMVLAVSIIISCIYNNICMYIKKLKNNGGIES